MPYPTTTLMHPSNQPHLDSPKATASQAPVTPAADAPEKFLACNLLFGLAAVRKKTGPSLGPYSHHVVIEAVGH